MHQKRYKSWFNYFGFHFQCFCCIYWNLRLPFAPLVSHKRPILSSLLIFVNLRCVCTSYLKYFCRDYQSHYHLVIFMYSGTHSSQSSFNSRQLYVFFHVFNPDFFSKIFKSLALPHIYKNILIYFVNFTIRVLYTFWACVFILLLYTNHIYFADSIY